jgi:hypothetical protein
MQAIINSDSIRIDGDKLRFLVQFPEITSGYHGIQIDFPATLDQMKRAILEVGVNLQKKLTSIADCKSNFQKYLDIPIEV